MLGSDDILPKSSAVAPDGTKNGDGLPEVASRDTEGPSATSNSGLTVTVGDRGPNDIPATSEGEPQDAATPVVVSVKQTIGVSVCRNRILHSESPLP